MADKLTDLYTSNPLTIDPGDLGYAVAHTGSVPDSGAFKLSQLMFNRYKISPTVAGNNLTLSLLHEDGTAPSTDRPLYFKIGGALRSVTSALLVTKNAATNWCNAGSAELATKELDYFVYVGYNATDKVVIGFSRIPYATIYSDFSVTTTNEKYCAISTITNAAAGDEYTVIGRFAATLSAGAGYTWSVPAYTASNLVQRPIYNTRLLTWAPQHSRSGGAYTNLPSVGIANYTIIGRFVHLNEQHTQNATPGSSGYQIFSLPLTASIQRPIFGENATAITGFQAYVFGAAGPTTISMFRYDGNQECTASNIYAAEGYYDI